MDIIIFSDIHNDVENLLTYFDKIKELKFDVIVCPGDFTDINTPKGFTQEDITKLIITELKGLKKPIMYVLYAGSEWKQCSRGALRAAPDSCEEKWRGSRKR